jgi:hypothetical protein
MTRGDASPRDADPSKADDSANADDPAKADVPPKPDEGGVTGEDATA